jgi:hypothetical protein
VFGTPELGNFEENCSKRSFRLGKADVKEYATNLEKNYYGNVTEIMFMQGPTSLRRALRIIGLRCG